MTCKDCLHYDVCQYHIDEETTMTVAECSHFKNKADFVKVVRCKDCKCYIPDSELDHNEYPNPLEADGLCEDIDKYTNETHFCSYGERRIAK